MLVVKGVGGGSLPQNCQITRFKNSVGVRFYSGELRIKILSVSGFIPENSELELAVSVSVRFKSPGI